MRKIPKGLLNEMLDDPFYKMCCLRHVSPCDTQEGVQFHHHLIHEGRQVNEKFCILPVCPGHHDLIHMPKLKGHADAIMIERATEEQLDEYNLRQRKDYLENHSPWETVLNQ